MNGKFLPFLVWALLLGSCIKDDFIDDRVDPVLRITPIVDTLEINTDFQFDYSYLDDLGQPGEVDVIWSSSDESVISIDENGLASAHTLGASSIKVEYMGPGIDLADSISVQVGEETVIQPTERSGSIQTTSSYVLQGDFILKEENGALVLEFESNYQASSSLPGLYVYLTNNPNTTNNAFEIGAVSVFSGAHSYEIQGVDLNQYNYVLYFCAPFNVKVGDGEIE